MPFSIFKSKFGYTNRTVMILLRNTLLLLLITVQLFAQQVSLPRSTPEAEGVSPEGIIQFLDAAAKSKHEFHSIIVMRHGKVIAEGWWNPYRPDLKHTMYSVSKSFAATAVGFAVAEKKLSVEDKVVSFFPDEVPAQISPYLAELRVKHLLTMTVGQVPDPTGPVAVSQNWVKTFLNTPILDEPGSKFLYNSVATYMLSAIVQKVTGQKVVDYLQSRLFQPLGITGIDWETDLKGINTGGWGLRLKTEDMAKFGQLFLQKGMWNGKQILPSSWVEEASTMKIMQEPDAPQVKKDSSDWLQGYCYQMWRSRHNSYRGDGAFGQYILVWPDQDAVVAVTAETTDMQGELDLIWKHILPSFQDKKLSNSKATKQLKDRLAALALPLPVSKSNAALEATVSGKTYNIVTNDRRFKSVSFDFKNNNCHLTLNTDSLVHTFDFGSGKWVKGETSRYGVYLVALAKNNRVGLPAFKVSGSYSWKDEKTLELILRYDESPHHEVIHCNFDEDVVSVDFENMFIPTEKRKIHRGIQEKPLANPPRLIVRGDDMGFSHSANQALIKSYREGIETSIEVIVPSPWFPEVVKLLKQNPRIDVGLHFAITSEWDNVKWRPLTDAPSLRNEDGYFYQMLYPNKDYPKQAVMDNAWKVEDVEKEMRAQIEMAKKYIPHVSHVSGHMNGLAFAPEVKALAAKLSKEYHLPMVDVDGAKEFGINYTWFDLKNKTTEQRIDAFIEMLNKLEDGKTYVYVEHPGLDNDELKAISHIGYEDVAQGRQDITTIFTSEKVKEAIVRKGIKLVSYKEVLEVKK